MNKKATSSSFFWSFLEKILAQVVSFFISIILARLLTPSEYSVIAASLIFISISEVVGTYGLGTSLIQKKNDVDDIEFSTIFNVSFLLGVFLYFVCFFSANYIESFFQISQLNLVIKILALKIPLSSINSVQRAICQRNLDFKKLFIPSLISTISSGAVGIFFVYSGFGIWSIVAQYLSKAIVDTVILFVIVRIPIKPVISLKHLAPLFKFGWKILVTSLLIKIYDELRSLFIGKKYQQSDLSLFNKGNQIPVLIVSTINSSMGSVLLPLISKDQHNLSLVKQRVSNFIKMTCFLIFPILFGLAAVSESLIVVLLTENWIGAVPYMWISCFTCLFLPVIEINFQAIRATGKSGVGLKNELIAKIIGLIAIVISLLFFNSPLIVAASFIIHSITSLITNSISSKKYLHYSFYEQARDIFPSLVLSGIMGIVVFVISFFIHNYYILLFTQIIIGIIFYISFSFLFHFKELFTIITFIKRKKEFSIN